MPIHTAWQPVYAQAVGLMKIVSATMEVTIIFKSNLKHLETTLDSLISKVYEIGELYKVCDAPSNQSIPDELMSLLENGKELVGECKDCWNFFKLYSYPAKLAQLDDALVRFCQVDLQVEQLRGIKLISLQMKRMNEKLDALNKQLERDKLTSLQMQAMNEKLDALNKKLERDTMGKTSQYLPYWSPEILSGWFSSVSVLSTAAIAVWVVLKLLLLVGLEFNFATVASWVDISIAALWFPPGLAVLSIGIVACVGLQFNFATVLPWVAISISILIRSQKESTSLGDEEESTSCTKKKDKESRGFLDRPLKYKILLFIAAVIILSCEDTDKAQASPQQSPNEDGNASAKSI